MNGEQEKIWFPACLEVTEGFDDSFKEGVRAFKRYHCGDTVNESKLKELFLSSWETSRRKEALVNYLSAVFCESMQYGAQLPERRLNYSGNIPRKLLLGPHTHSDKRSDFIKDNYHGILSAIDTLKSDPQWRDIGDYYYAVRFLCGMMDEVLGNDAGVWLGGVMIAELKETGNKYAARLTEIINDSLL